jgi:hypothetical protein
VLTLALAMLAAAQPAGDFAGMSAADRSAILKAAGFSQEGGAWKGCGGLSELITENDWIDGGTVRDLNGDGKAEVIIGDRGLGCYGQTEQGFTILTQAGPAWKAVYASEGLPTFLPSRGTGGWQDIEVGGPGFCFPVVRWNGKTYATLRHQYEGKPCRP